MRKVIWSFKSLMVLLGLVAFGVVGLWYSQSGQVAAQPNNASPVDFTYFFGSNSDIFPDQVGIPDSNLTVVSGGQTKTIASPTIEATAFNSRQRCSSSLFNNITALTEVGISNFKAYNVQLDGDEICFKISGTDENSNQIAPVYAHSYTPTSSFGRAIFQDGSDIRFNYVSGFSQYRVLTEVKTNANQIACTPADFDDTTKYANFSRNRYDLGDDYSDTNDGNWLCLRARRSSGSRYRYVYFALKLDTTKPVITFQQFADYNEPASQRRITATVDSSYTEDDINQGSWQYRGPTTTDLTTCGQSQFESSSGSTLTGVKNGYKITVSEADNDKWVCFRVADQAGNYGYTSGQLTDIDFSGPLILNLRQTVENSQQTISFNLTGQDNNFGSVGYKYLVKTSGNCSTTTVPTNANNGDPLSASQASINLGNLTGLKHNNLVCIWSEDVNRNLTASQIKVDLQAPNISGQTLQLSTSGHTIMITNFKTAASDTVSYSLETSDPGNQCANANLDPGTVVNGQVERQTSHTYLCLAVSDQYGNQSPRRRFGLPSVSSYLPGVLAKQRGSQVSAGALGSITANNWRYRVLNNSTTALADCRQNPQKHFNASVVVYTVDSLVNLQAANDNNKIYCFSARSGSNYASDGVVIDLTPPKLVVSQVSTVYMIAQTTATDLKPDGWLAAVLANGVTACNADTFSNQQTRSAYQNLTIDVDNDNGKTACFSAQDVFNNTSYASAVINTSGSVISLNQTNDLVTINTSSATDKVYYVLRSGSLTSVATCRTSGSYQRNTSGQVKLQERHGRNYYLCVKATDSNNTSSYAYLNLGLVDKTAPKITTSKQGTLLSASDDDPQSTHWQYKVLGLNETCSKTIPRQWCPGIHRGQRPDYQFRPRPDLLFLVNR